MQVVITGIGPDQRSRVEAIHHPDPPVDPERGIGHVALWGTSRWPPTPPFVAPTSSHHLDIGIESGWTTWRIVRFGPAAATSMHWTDSLDYEVVLSGSLTLDLEEGSVVLEPGDMVLVAGVIHAWRAGPEGCVLAAMLVGTAPAAG